MKQDQYSEFNAVKVKAKADYLCKLCGSDKMVQAHAPGGDHTDWRKGMCLCAECHSKQHPDMPRNLFFSRTNQPYWPNISARALAHEFNCHNRTVIRTAKAFEIPSGSPLSAEDKERLRKQITAPFSPRLPKPATTIEYPKEPCPECNSKWVRYRTLSNTFVCHRCGHIWST